MDHRIKREARDKPVIGGSENVRGPGRGAFKRRVKGEFGVNYSRVGGET